MFTSQISHKKGAILVVNASVHFRDLRCEKISYSASKFKLTQHIQMKRVWSLKTAVVFNGYGEVSSPVA